MHRHAKTKNLAVSPMSFTLSTIPLLLLALYLKHKGRGEWLPTIILMSVFQAASVIVVNAAGAGLGIGASQLLLPLGALQSISRPKALVPWQIRRSMQLTSTSLALFIGYASLSAFINPLIFKGVLITNAKYGIQIPLEWKPAYLSQLVYLWAAIVIYYIVAYRTTAHAMITAVNWYIGGAVLGAVGAVYQYICLVTGLPFPSAVLHTGPYTIFEAYEINGFARVNSTFSEAAAAASFFAPALAIILWKILSGEYHARNLFFAGLIFIGLMLTISTTGYICLAMIMVVGLWKYLIHPDQRGYPAAVKCLLITPLLAVAFLVVANPAIRTSVSSLVHTVVLDKKDTESFRQRTEWNDEAIATASDTYWLGAGWGICRGSSIIPTLLGNVGLFGLSLYGFAVVQVFAPAILRPKTINSIHGSVLFALSIAFVNLLVSAPELTSPLLWLLFAVAARLSAANKLRKKHWQYGLTNQISLSAAPHTNTAIKLG